MGCGHNAAFATFVSGDKYVPGAICLLRSLRATGSQCTVDLVYDDRTPSLNLSAHALGTLKRVYGAEHIFSLAHIMANHPLSAKDMDYSTPRRNRHAGRALFERGVEHMATHSKLWLWGMPRSRVVILDSDMVALAPLDWMLTYELGRHQMAAAAWGGGSRSFFNSGLLIIEPNPNLLANLTRLAHVARSGVAPEGHNSTIPKVGEKLFGDQSLLNWYFRSHWKPLPSSMMALAPAKAGVVPAKLRGMDPAVIHWLSEPKPWSRAVLKPEGDVVGQKRGVNAQAQLWWELCRDRLDGVPPASFG